MSEVKEKFEEVLSGSGVQGRMCYLRLPINVWKFLEATRIGELDLSDHLSLLFVRLFDDDISRKLEHYNKSEGKSLTKSDLRKFFEEAPCQR